MIISDLNHLEVISEETRNLNGAYAAVNIGNFASAFGNFTLTASNSNSWAISSPYFGSAALGYGQVIAIAYTPSKW